MIYAFAYFVRFVTCAETLTIHQDKVNKNGVNTPKIQARNRVMSVTG